MKKESLDIGIIGAGVMGGNLARNIAGRGYRVGVYDLDFSKASAVCKDAGGSGGSSLVPAEKLEQLVDSLSRPRKLGLMVNAGKPVDDLLLKLSDLLEEGDLVMDLGNSYYKDTQKREKAMEQRGIVFFGVGVSGGEKGALYGPSIMAGCGEYGWKNARKILTDICAVAEDGEPCCKNFGAHGAGHFVKMVHNGIEYAYMEAISEIYMIFRKGYGKESGEIGEILDQWSKDRKVNSYLLEITSQIASKRDDRGDGLLIDKIRDRAGSKGTGLWTSETALELHSCSPVLIEALLLRYLSAEDDLRSAYHVKEETRTADPGYDMDSGSAPDPGSSGLESDCVEDVFKTLELIQYVCFEQGLKIIERASEEYGWNIGLSDVISVWKAGCIIRTDFLDTIKEAVSTAGGAKILACREIRKTLAENYQGILNVIHHSLASYVPTPVISSGLQYYIASRSETLPTSVIQAQRDYFGAHGYERTDMDGTYHSEW